MNTYERLLITSLSLACCAQAAPTVCRAQAGKASAQTQKTSPQPASQQPQQQAQQRQAGSQPGSKQQSQPSAGGGKVQLVVQTKAGAKKEDINQALEEANGTIVNSTSDGTNTFYLVEVDRAKYNESYRTLSKDKNIKSIGLNRQYSLR